MGGRDDQIDLWTWQKSPRFPPISYEKLLHVIVEAARGLVLLQASLRACFEFSTLLRVEYCTTVPYSSRDRFVSMSTVRFADHAQLLMESWGITASGLGS